MNMRSSFAILFATLGAVAAVTNCTVKSVEGDGKAGSSNTTGNTVCDAGDSKACTCTNGKKGAQECNDEGSGYAACVCDGVIDTGGTGGTGGASDGGAGNETSGGTANTGGTNTPAGGASEGGAGGADPVGIIDPEDCSACLAALCPTQWDACVADTQCLSANLDGSGEYEKIQNGCIEVARLDGPVKRDAARGCGVSIGQSTDPAFNDDWAPQQMAPATANLMNCMAMGANMPDASWANDPDNFPIVNEEVQPTPWPAGSCAKLACTSQIQ